MGSWWQLAHAFPLFTASNRPLLTASNGPPDHNSDDGARRCSLPVRMEERQERSKTALSETPIRRLRRGSACTGHGQSWRRPSRRPRPSSQHPQRDERLRPHTNPTHQPSEHGMATSRNGGEAAGGGSTGYTAGDGFGSRCYHASAQGDSTSSCVCSAAARVAVE